MAKEISCVEKSEADSSEEEEEAAEQGPHTVWGFRILG